MNKEFFNKMVAEYEMIESELLNCVKMLESGLACKLGMEDIVLSEMVELEASRLDLKRRIKMCKQLYFN